MKRTTFSVVFFCKKTKLTKKGTAPIYARITTSGRSTEIYTQCRIEPEHWNQRLERCMLRDPVSTQINGILATYRTNILAAYDSLIKEGKTPDCFAIKHRLEHAAASSRMFLVEFSKYCDKRQREVGIRLTQLTANKYHRLLRYMTEYTREQYRKDDLPLDAIDYAYIDGLNTFMQTAHNCKNNGAVNLLCCLIAKKAGNGCQTIARVRNPEYSQEVRFIREELGMAMVINPEQAAASEMARILRFPSAIKIETFANGHIELLQFRIGANSVLNNMRIADMGAKLHCEVLVCTVVRGDQVIIPDGNVVLQERDIVSIVAPPKMASQFFKKIKVQTDQVRDTLIIGGSTTAYYLAKQLLTMGIDVKIIDKNRERCEELSDLLPKATIICGEGTDQDVLMEEGVNWMDSFVTLTDVDEENILLSLFAKEHAPKIKSITKVNNTTFDEVINKLDLDSIIYPKYVTAEYIVRYVRAMKNTIGSNVETLYRLVNNRVEALEFVIRQSSPILDIPLEKLSLKKNLLIASIYRDGVLIMPNGQDVMSIGDKVIVVTTNQGLDDISDIVKER